jgi:ribosome-binding protein aMBF1 (putative translation factor)
MQNGPTLNNEYNALLIAWAEQGASSKPECEECGCDLTGKPVIETAILWVCEDCADGDDDYTPANEYDYLERACRRRDPDREDFHSDG